MARRRSRKAAKKLPPTELTILGALDGENNYVCDVGSLLSQINRKTYRQGYQYAIQSIQVISYEPDSVTNVVVGRLPHHWACVNAWTKTMNLWRQQQNERLQESGLEQTVARYRDFKIFIDGDHAEGNYSELQPQTMIGTGSGLYRTVSQAQAVSPTVDMDWDKSQVVIPNKGAPGTTVEWYCHMLGDDTGTSDGDSFGMIKAYAQSRNRPMQTDPNIVDVASGGVFGEMFNVADDTGDIVTNAQNQNDQLPYLNDVDSALEFYPGGENQGNGLTLVDALQIVSTGNRTMSSATIGPFLANCGLFVVGADEPCSIIITVAPGDYKGVMARPMQAVN